MFDYVCDSLSCLYPSVAMSMSFSCCFLLSLCFHLSVSMSMVSLSMVWPLCISHYALPSVPLSVCLSVCLLSLLYPYAYVVKNCRCVSFVVTSVSLSIWLSVCLALRLLSWTSTISRPGHTYDIQTYFCYLPLAGSL